MAGVVSERASKKWLKGTSGTAGPAKIGRDFVLILARPAVVAPLFFDVLRVIIS